MYRVVEQFADLQDGNHGYKAGDVFPRDGVTVSEKRLNELSSSKNKRGIPLIELVEDRPVVKEGYSEDELSDMTTKEIKEIAAERGYTITKVAKADVIDQFLEQQK